MPELDLTKYLNQAALAVMAAAFLWLVKTIVNDLKHDISTLLKLSEAAGNDVTNVLNQLRQVTELLERIERNGRPAAK